MKFIISSSDRSASSSSSSDFTVPISIVIPKGTYSLEYVLLPNGVYNVNSTNNKIYFNDGSNKTATITSGFYTTSSLPTAVKTAMDTASGGTQTYTITINPDTQVMTIASTGNTSLKFGTNTTNSSASILGFSNTDTTASGSNVGNYIVNLNRQNFYKVNINSISNNYHSGTQNVNSTFVIPITSNPQEVISYAPEESFSQHITFENNVKELRVVVTDESSNTINLNGVEWFFIIKMKSAI